MDILKKRWMASAMAPALLIQNSKGELSLQQAGAACPVPGMERMDKYTAGIELSNACRTYYASRLRTAEGMKKKLSLPPKFSPPPSASSCSSSSSSSSSSPSGPLSASVMSLTSSPAFPAVDADSDVDEGYITQRPSSHSSTSASSSASKSSSVGAPHKHTSIDKAMDKLRNELVSWSCLYSSSFIKHITQKSYSQNTNLLTSMLCK
jgi:hypothetical protein